MLSAGEKVTAAAQMRVINQEDESFSLVLFQWDSLTILDIKLLHGIVLVDHGGAQKLKGS